MRLDNPHYQRRENKMRTIVYKIFVVIFTLFILVIISGCTGTKQFIDLEQQITAQPPQLRVLSYNIHYGIGTDGKFDVGRIAKVINTANPDIVALQEVERKRVRTLWVDEAKKLARLTGLTAVFEPNITYFGGGGYGNAILSRFPIISHENHLIPHVKGSQRGILQADLAIPQEYGFGDSLALHFFSTHLAAGGGNRPERIISSNFIEDLVQPLLGSPMILAGDFNDEPDSRPMSIFRNVWAIAGDGEILKTHPSPDPQRQIDYILFHPKGMWKAIEVRVIDETIASDHRPILVVLEWRGNKKDDS
ncbi:endonuclease/exonuclease/phosphatase family protein, partial [Patescibacteria group bacterium AH-259-L07]|nr:endonuclease/exonuclease/phosphatase family protein [Patescibacteria group bacterium AH-259-L07]